MKIGNLNLNLKTVNPVVKITDIKPIGISFNKKNVAAYLYAAKAGQVSLNVDEVNVMTQMLSVFDSPSYNPNVAVSGTPEEGAIISKAVRIFAKTMNNFWNRNFANFSVFPKESMEEDTKNIIAFTQDNLLFYLRDTFKPAANERNGVRMKTLDYLLTALRKHIENYKLISTKIQPEAVEVVSYVAGVINGLYFLIEKGREAAPKFKATGVYNPIVINDKPATSEELGFAEVIATAITMQKTFAESRNDFSRADIVSLFIMESEGKEFPIRKLLFSTIEQILNPDRFGSEDSVIENAVESENEEFEDTFVGLHRNSHAIENIEIPTEKPTKAKK